MQKTGIFFPEVAKVKNLFFIIGTITTALCIYSIVELMRGLLRPEVIAMCEIDNRYGGNQAKPVIGRVIKKGGAS